MEETINVKQGNPFAAAFKGTLGKGCGCVVLIIIAFVVLVAMVGSGNSNKKTETKDQTEIKRPVAPVKITARDLADAFDENQVAAETNWSGKFVEFSASISNITDSGLSFSNIASKQFSMAQISCKIKDKQQVLSLKKEQTVTVRGVVGKQFIGVIDLSDCEVVQ